MSEGATKHPHTLTDLRATSVQLPSLVVVAASPDGAELEAPLGVAPVVAGTSPECQIVVRDPRVSRRHCMLALKEDGVLLRDLGSKNKTFVGDMPIVEGWLPIGTAARIGNTRITVRVSGAPTTLPLSMSPCFGEAIGASLPMRALFATLERASATSETVLLLGESGTGKELLARAIHDASPRKDGPFVVFDCSAVPANLLEAELFGHVRGAFTNAHAAREGLFEQANDGTLFIDEIAELPLDLQPKLLRALESRKVRRIGANDWRGIDLRIVAATHRNLAGMVGSGAFRQDLYYRLAVVQVRVPPLRERKADIEPLVAHFLAAAGSSRSIEDLAPATMALLRAHEWPGNVRELKNAVARLLLFPEVPEQALGPAPGAAGTGALAPLLCLPLREAREMVVEHFEREYLKGKLAEYAGNVSRAAESMQVSRQFVHRLLERHGLRGGTGRDGPGH